MIWTGFGENVRRSKSVASRTSAEKNWTHSKDNWVSAHLTTNLFRKRRWRIWRPKLRIKSQCSRLKEICPPVSNLSTTPYNLLPKCSRKEKNLKVKLRGCKLKTKSWMNSKLMEWTRNGSLWKAQCGWVEEYATKSNVFARASTHYRLNTSSATRAPRKWARPSYSELKYGS